MLGKWSWFALVAICIVIASLGINACQVRNSVVVRGSGDPEISLETFLDQDFNPHSDQSDVTLDFATLAAIAANVYEEPNSLNLNCLEEGRIALDGWGLLRLEHVPAVCNALQSGLHYEIWGKLDVEREYGYVVVAFRGTIPRLVGHWCSNLRNAYLPFCDSKSDQYLAIVPLIDNVLDSLRGELGWDFYAITVGHSLGGGLAELAARASYIDQAITFDPSPVIATKIAETTEDAFGSLDSIENLQAAYDENGCAFSASNPPENRDLVVHRVYEHGEILAYLRPIKRWFEAWSGLESQVIEYRTNLLRGGPIGQHGIKALACALRDAQGGGSLRRAGYAAH